MFSLRSSREFSRERFERKRTIQRMFTAHWHRLLGSLIYPTDSPSSTSSSSLLQASYSTSDPPPRVSISCSLESVVENAPASFQAEFSNPRARLHSARLGCISNLSFSSVQLVVMDRYFVLRELSFNSRYCCFRGLLTSGLTTQPPEATISFSAEYLRRSNSWSRKTLNIIVEAFDRMIGLDKTKNNMKTLTVDMVSTTPSKKLPSGSGWGIDELERFRFAKEPTRFALQDFPWKDLVPDDGVDPFADVSSIMEVIFGNEDERNHPSIESGVRRFYSALDCLKGKSGEPESVNIRRMRSKRNFNSSSPMMPLLALQAATADEGSSYERENNSSTQAPPRHASPGTVVDNDALTPGVTSVQSTDDSYRRGIEQIQDTDQSPIAAYLKRRRLSLKVQGESTRFERRALRHFDSTTAVLDCLSKEDDGSDASIPGSATTFQSPQKSSTSEDSFEDESGTPLAILFSEHHFPSSQTDPTYRESSTFSAETMSIPRIPDPYENQAEESTNYMMRLLLDIVCETLNKRASRPTITFKVSHDTDTLYVPIGKGDFIKTRPDLKITIDMDGKTMTILDYEAIISCFVILQGRKI